MSQVFPLIPAPAKTIWLLGFLNVFMAVLLWLSIALAYSSSHLQLELTDPNGEPMALVYLAIFLDGSNSTMAKKLSCLLLLTIESSICPLKTATLY
jgi:hypothetical protein